MYPLSLHAAWRHLVRRLGPALVSVIGLSLALTVCLLVGLYVRHEESYDRYHRNTDRLYRVVLGPYGGGPPQTARTMPPLAERLRADYPEVQAVTRLYARENIPVRVGDAVRLEERVHFADSTIFDVFSLDVVQGDPRKALAHPGSVVLTESAARTYFDDRNPVGRVLEVKAIFEYVDLTVTAVVRDPPATTHVPFRFIASLTSLPRGAWGPYWDFHGIYTYVVLREDALPEALEQKLADRWRSYLEPFLQQGEPSATFDTYVASGRAVRPLLEPVVDIHLYSPLKHSLGPPGGDTRILRLFSVIAAFILLMAGVNYVNLSTARAAHRAKEIGVRKVLGASRQRLAVQFVLESVLISLAASLLALVPAALLLPAFGALTGTALSPAALLEAPVLAAVLALGVGVGLLAGSYPALHLSALSPVRVLRGALHRRARLTLRNGLVVFQFAVAAALLIGTGGIVQQVRYLLRTDPGFDREHVVCIRRAWTLGRELGTTFKQELLRRPDVVGAAYMRHLPGDGYMQGHARPADRPDHDVAVRWLPAHTGFDTLLGLDLLAGRSFSEDFATDTLSILINEQAARAFGWDDPLGRQVTTSAYDDRTFTVIGVLKDYHFAPLRQEIAPLIVSAEDDESWGAYLAVRVQPHAAGPVLEAARGLWRRLNPDEPFEVTVLDAFLDRLYRPERHLGRAVTTFAVLAVLIACLGLYSLTAYITERRSREIGIRKVLGATVPGVLWLLSSTFIRLVGCGFVLAVPPAYLGLRRWLDGFAYRIELSGWIFLSVGGIILGVTLLTVGIQAWRAATVHPARVLRAE